MTDFKEENKKMFIDMAETQLTEYLIEASQMVQDGKINNSGGKILYNELMKNHNQTLARIEYICK